MNKLKRLEIEVTRRCPYNCLHCSTSAGKFYKDKLTTSEIIKIIEQFSALNGKELVITGGEPFLRGENFFDDILYHTHIHKIKTYIYTTGYALNNNILNIIKKYNNIMICISIEGYKETHNMITGNHISFDTAINAIKTLKRNNICIKIHFTPMKINYREINYVYQLAKEYSIDVIKIFKFVPQGRGCENERVLSINNVELNEFVSKINKLKFGCKTEFGGSFKGIKDNCSIGKKIIITSEGEILPCLGLRNINLSFGNIYEDSLKKIWENILTLNSNKTCLCKKFDNLINPIMVPA